MGTSKTMIIDITLEKQIEACIKIDTEKVHLTCIMSWLEEIVKFWFIYLLCDKKLKCVKIIRQKS